MEQDFKRQILMDHYVNTRMRGLKENDPRYDEVHNVSESCIDDITVQMYVREDTVEEYVPTDTSLITINTDGTQHAEGTPWTDAYGHVDEDGDGIIIETVKGKGYSGYMMIVEDPSRVIMGSIPSSYGREGYVVKEFVEHFDGVAGTNAGGFYDPNGMGDGSIPDSVVVVDGRSERAHV